MENVSYFSLKFAGSVLDLLILDLSHNLRLAFKSFPILPQMALFGKKGNFLKVLEQFYCSKNDSKPSRLDSNQVNREEDKIHVNEIDCP